MENRKYTLLNFLKSEHQDAISFEIPIIQRDYAQGRSDERSQKIRKNKDCAFMGVDAARFCEHRFFKREPCCPQPFPYRSGNRLSRSDGNTGVACARPHPSRKRSGGLIADTRAFVKPLLQRRGASDKKGKVHIRMRTLRNGIDQTGLRKQRRFIQQRLHRKGGEFFANSISPLNLIDSVDPIGRCTFRSITFIY